MSRAGILVAAGALVLALASYAPAQAAVAVPYKDANVTGTISLCDKANKPIDHGRLADRPFVWSAVSSVAAPTPYDADGRTATLFAYQPRQGLVPAEWSGELLTSSTRYTNAAHPTAAATALDEPLATFVGDYPPQWSGLIQLRLYLGAPGQPPLTKSYVAADIQVSGSTWTLLNPGPSNCGTSQATSLEQVVPGILASTTTVPGGTAATSVPTQTAPGAVDAAGGTAGAAPSSTAADGAADGTTSVTEAASTSSRSSTATARAVVIGVTAILIAAWLAYSWRRHQRRPVP